MIRSILCVPGHQGDRVLRALVSPADMVLLDLEDAVPLAKKTAARETVGFHLEHPLPAGGPLLAVRVNSVSSAEFDHDLKMLQAAHFSGWLWLPKVEGPGDVAVLEDALVAAALDVRICALVESPAAVVMVASGWTAQAMEVDAVAFGRHDFLAAAGISERQDALVEHAQLQVALAARAAGIPCWDAPCYRGEDYLHAEIDFAVRAGFTGKGCLSPAQIEAVNDAFSVPDSELHRARAILEAAEVEAEAVARLGSDMLSPPTVRWARATLAKVDLAEVPA